MAFLPEFRLELDNIDLPTKGRELFATEFIAAKGADNKLRGFLHIAESKNDDLRFFVYETGDHDTAKEIKGSGVTHKVRLTALKENILNGLVETGLQTSRLKPVGDKSFEYIVAEILKTAPPQAEAAHTSPSHGNAMVSGTVPIPKI